LSQDSAKQNYLTPMSVVFVKYVNDDRKTGDAIAAALKKAGIEVVGPDGERALDLASAPCLILLWSEAAAKAPTAQQDVQEAVQAWSGGRLILVRADDAELPVGLRDLSAIGVPSDLSGWTDLIEQVQTITAQPASPDRKDSASAGTTNRKAFVRPVLWISACLAVALGAVLGWRSYTAPQSRDLTASSSDITYVLAFAILGIVIGAAAMWAWSRWPPRPLRSEPLQAGPLGPETTTIAPRIFVSYSRQDTAAVEKLVKDIERAGHEVWIDRDVEGAQRYAAAIVSAIKSAELVALMGSRNAFASDHVIREVYVAGDHKKRFVVFQLDQSEFPDEVLYFTTGFPRISVAALDHQRLRNELSRLLLAGNGA